MFINCVVHWKNTSLKWLHVVRATGISLTILLKLTAKGLLISKKDSSGSQLTERTGTIKTAVEPLKSSNMIVSSKSHNYKTHLIDRDSRRRAFVWAKCLFESVDGNFLIAFIEVNCRSAIVTINGNQAEELKSYHERLKKDAITKVKERPATGKWEWLAKVTSKSD